MKTKTTKYMQSGMDNPEKLVTSGKQDEDKQSKNTTQKAEHMKKKDHRHPLKASSSCLL